VAHLYFLIAYKLHLFFEEQRYMEKIGSEFYVTFYDKRLARFDAFHKAGLFGWLYAMVYFRGA
jgi:hypothetical protein